MKRAIVVLVLIVALLALATGWWWVRTKPQQALQFLVNRGVETDRAGKLMSQAGRRDRHGGE